MLPFSVHGMKPRRLQSCLAASDGIRELQMSQIKSVRTKRPKGAPVAVPPWELSLTSEQQGLVERAAAYAGRSVPEFIRTAVQHAARSVVEEHEVWRLNSQESRRFVETLLNPPAPNAVLRQAARQHRSDVVSR